MTTNTFDEEETGYVNLAFTDEDGTAVIPDSATYTLYDEVSGGIINDRTAVDIGSLAASVDLELEPDDNVIVDTDKTYEAHVLLVEWIYNTDKQGKEIYRFTVQNLAKVP